MNNPLLVLVVGILLAGVVFGLIAMWRLRSLSLRVGSFECALKRPNSRRPIWRAGIILYRQQDLGWYPIISVGMRPRYRFSRTEFEVIEHRVRMDNEAKTGIIEARCHTKEYGEIIIAAPKHAYHGLVSWAESAPPGYRGNDS